MYFGRNPHLKEKPTAMLSLIRKSLPALCLLLTATGAHGQLPEEEKRRIGELTARFAEALQAPDGRLLDAFFERWQRQELTIGAGEPLIDTLYWLATDTVTLKRLGIGRIILRPRSRYDILPQTKYCILPDTLQLTDIHRIDQDRMTLADRLDTLPDGRMVCINSRQYPVSGIAFFPRSRHPERTRYLTRVYQHAVMDAIDSVWALTCQKAYSGVTEGKGEELLRRLDERISGLIPYDSYNWYLEYYPEACVQYIAVNESRSRAAAGIILQSTIYSGRYKTFRVDLAPDGNGAWHAVRLVFTGELYIHIDFF